MSTITKTLSEAINEGYLSCDTNAASTSVSRNENQLKIQHTTSTSSSYAVITLSETCNGMYFIPNTKILISGKAWCTHAPGDDLLEGKSHNARAGTDITSSGKYISLVSFSQAVSKDSAKSFTDKSTYYSNRQFQIGFSSNQWENFYWYFEDLTFTFTYGYKITDGSNKIRGKIKEDLTVAYEPGTSVTLTASANPGYSFIGWSDGVTTASRSVTIKANETYTPLFEPINYTISYNLNGGSATNVEEYNIESSNITLINPTRAHYTFIGWQGTDISGTSTSVTIENGSMGNRSYVAQWTPTPYKINYINVENITNTLITSYHIESDFTLTNPTKTGYAFTGWTGEGITIPNKAVKINLGTTGNKTYTANWNVNTYSITYNLNGGNWSPGVSGEASFTIESQSFDLKHPERRGYTFDGWEDSSGNKVISIPNGSIGNRTFTANWIINTYTINYEYIDGTKKINNFNQLKTQYTIETNTFSLVEPIRAGYSFMGFSGEGNQSPTRLVTIEKGSIGDKTYTIHFDADNKKLIGTTRPENAGIVRFYFDEQTYDSTESIREYSDNQSIFKIDVSYNNKDYKFSHWELATGTSAELSLNDRKLSSNDSENIYIAVFEPIYYDIKINMQLLSGETGRFGHLITDNSSDEYGKNIIEQDGGVILKNLRFGEKRKFTIIPYAHATNKNYRYRFLGWQYENDPVTNIHIDENWSTAVNGIKTLMFEKIEVVDSIQGSNNYDIDKWVAKTIIERTIQNFISKKITRIGSYGLHNCSSLNYLICSNVLSLGYYALANCSELNFVLFAEKDSSGSDGNTFYENCFQNCDKLNLLILPGNSFISLQSLFNDNDDNIEIDDNEKSLFAQGMGRIYVHPDRLKEYQEAEKWKQYAKVIEPINNKIYWTEEA